MDAWLGMLALVFAAVGFSTWQDFLPWWTPYVAFGAILFYGFLRENYEEFSVVEGERNALKGRVESDEKRTAVALRLQQLYNQGDRLQFEVLDSTDESPTSEWLPRYHAWRDEILDYMEYNVSRGKAQYVDGVAMVYPERIHGMKSETTRREKEAIIIHVKERLKRLAEVMKDY
jgi:hypothetical protein